MKYVFYLVSGSLKKEEEILEISDFLLLKYVFVLPCFFVMILYAYKASFYMFQAVDSLI